MKGRRLVLRQDTKFRYVKPGFCEFTFDGETGVLSIIARKNDGTLIGTNIDLQTWQTEYDLSSSSSSSSSMDYSESSDSSSTQSSASSISSASSESSSSGA